MAEGKTYEEIEREYAEIRRQHKEFEGLVPVRARVSESPRSIFSVPFMPGELGLIEKAAKKRRMKISDFIRKAALAAVPEDADLSPGEKAAAIEEVREKARLLSKAVRRL